MRSNRIGYTGPLSIEWEDSGMDREYGARDALAFVRRTDFPTGRCVRRADATRMSERLPDDGAS